MIFFSLAYREQQQLFLYDKSYLGELLLQCGGLSMLIARFLVQFFHAPVTAAIVTGALLALAAALLFLSAKGKGGAGTLPLCFIPSAFLACSLRDNYMHYEMLVAVVLALGALLFYSRRKSRKALWGCCLAIFLYLVAGPAALLFAVSAFCLDFCKERSYRSLRGLANISVAIAIGCLAVKAGWVATLGKALTPAFFYDNALHMPKTHLYGWIAIPITVAASALASSASGKSRILPAAGCLAVLAGGIFVAKETASHDKGMDLFYEYEHYVAGGQWDKLAKVSGKHLDSHYSANYYNMAKAEDGLLLEDLFAVPQKGPNNLIFIPEDKNLDVRLAHLMYSMGNVAAAQDAASDCLHSTCGLNPQMLKMLSKIELVRGSWEVADKYLSLLEKTPHYKAWARYMKQFLHDDGLVREDKELGAKRKGMSDQECFVMSSPMKELSLIVRSNPGDSKTMQYALSYLLLCKDLNAVWDFVEEYHETPGLQALPTPVQEALVFIGSYYHTISRESAIDSGISPELYDKYQIIDDAWCLENGVSERVLERFKLFKDENSMTPDGFEDTYWHYLLYTRI